MAHHHALTSDFPEFFSKIKELHTQDPLFRQQSERYHALDREIHALESRGVPISDQLFIDMKMERAQLKDSLYRQILER